MFKEVTNDSKATVSVLYCPSTSFGTALNMWPLEQLLDMLPLPSWRTLRIWFLIFIIQVILCVVFLPSLPLMATFRIGFAGLTLWPLLWEAVADDWKLYAMSKVQTEELVDMSWAIIHTPRKEYLCLSYCFTVAFFLARFPFLFIHSCWEYRKLGKQQMQRDEEKQRKQQTELKRQNVDDDDDDFVHVDHNDDDWELVDSQLKVL